MHCFHSAQMDLALLVEGVVVHMDIDTEILYLNLDANHVECNDIA